MIYKENKRGITLEYPAAVQLAHANHQFD